MHRVPFVQTGGLITVIGGCIWVFALETQTLALAMILCWAGVVTIYYYSTQQASTKIVTIGFGLTSFGMLGWLGAWLGYRNNAILSTRYRWSESGQIIDVINYTVGYIAQRYLAIPAYLVFGVGLLLLARGIRLQPWNVLIRLLGYLSLSLYCSLVWEVYLDAITLPFVYPTLRLLFALGWLALGYLLWSRATHLPAKAYRQFS
jgi:hypothetical protein